MSGEHEFEVRPDGEALRLHNDTYLNHFFDEAERAAIERGISANPSDHETRLTASVEVRAIRSLRTQLKSLSEGKTKRPTRASPA